MKISIAVPSFNYGKYIPACLESIHYQNYPEFEVLLADGGSTDNSVALIEAYCQLDARFRFVSRSDAGQVDAIIRAFSYASGDVFCFLNADDLYLANDVFSTAVATFRSRPEVGVVTFGGYYVDEKANRTRRVRLRYHPLDNIGMMKYRSGALQPATFWTRAVHESFPLRKEYDYSFDTVFFYEAWTRYRWLEVPTKIVAGYRLHGANKSVQIVPERVRELARFERMKFGQDSFRSRYLEAVGSIVKFVSNVPLLGNFMKKFVRLCVNGLAYLSVYRLPSI